MKILFLTCLNLNGTHDARIYVNAIGAHHYLYNLTENQIQRLIANGAYLWN